MNPSTVHQYYTEDHQRLDALFHEFQAVKATDRARAAKSFQEFKAGLERHIVWEEQILFPAFDRRFGHLLDGPTGVMRWEHQQIRRFLDAIALKLDRQDFDTVEEEVGLETVLCPHNYREEEILYPMMDQVVKGEERAQIFAAMESTK